MRSTMTLRTSVLFVVFVAAAALLGHAGGREPALRRASFSRFPMVVGRWQGHQEPAFDRDTLAVLGVDDYLTRGYVRGASVVGLYIGYWASQRQGDAIHSPLNCLPGAGWEPLSKRDLRVQVSDPDGAAPRPIAINRYVVQKGLERVLVLYWYQSHGRVVASEYLGKAYQIVDAVRLHRTDAAIVRVVVAVAPDDERAQQAERTGVAFIQQLFPLLPRYLPS